MCKILIVDDVEEIRQELRKNLIMLFPEHKIYSLNTTEESLKLLESLDKVEIIFFNSLKTGNIDGATFAEKVRKKSPYTILIYINPEKEINYSHFLKLSRIGIDGYLKVPLEIEMIQFMVINSLNRLKNIENYKLEEHKQLEKAIENFSNKVNVLFSTPPKKPRGLLTKLLSLA